MNDLFLLLFMPPVFAFGYFLMDRAGSFAAEVRRQMWKRRGL